MKLELKTEEEINNFLFEIRYRLDKGGFIEDAEDIGVKDKTLNYIIKEVIKELEKKGTPKFRRIRKGG